MATQVSAPDTSGGTRRRAGARPRPPFGVSVGGRVMAVLITLFSLVPLGYVVR